LQVLDRLTPEYDAATAVVAPRIMKAAAAARARVLVSLQCDLAWLCAARGELPLFGGTGLLAMGISGS
jgi:hypothetical protein